MLRQVLDRLLTGSPQGNWRKELALTQDHCRQLRHDFTLLARNVEDHQEKTRRSLERYRARAQGRKDGRFGPEDAPDASNGFSSIPNPTHEQIAAEARRQGMIS